MKVLDGIRATGTQKLSTAAENGTLIEMVLYFLPASQSWKIDITYGDFVLNGNRVYNSPNMLCQYSNIIPFGLSCTVEDGGEPFLVNDFSGGRCQLLVLTAADVLEIEEALMEGEFLS